MWNTLTSPKEQTTNVLENKSSGDVSDQTCFMVQGNDSLEVNSDTQFVICVSSSNDDNTMNAHALNEELSMFCKNLLSKYKFLKSKSFDLKKKNELLFSNLDLILKEKVEDSSKRYSLKF